MWDACSESLITFDQDNQSRENCLAYIVENDVIQCCLLERLKQLHIEPRLNSKVKQFQYDENSIRIELQDEKAPLQIGLLVRFTISFVLFLQLAYFLILFDCRRWLSINYSKSGSYFDHEMEL